jgi:hemoglobin
MKKTLIALTVACASLLTAPSFAQTAMAQDALYKIFGEKAGLVKLMDDFVNRLKADSRTGPHFKDANPRNLKEQLVDQVCQVTGGPCVYQGSDMKSAHSGMDIKTSDFNALVEVMQQAMDAQGIPFQAQNQLLAKLAPMHRDIISVK